jgi:hypothetical protein
VITSAEDRNRPGVDESARSGPDRTMGHADVGKPRLDVAAVNEVPPVPDGDLLLKRRIAGVLLGSVPACRGTERGTGSARDDLGLDRRA